MIFGYRNYLMALLLIFSLLSTLTCQVNLSFIILDGYTNKPVSNADIYSFNEANNLIFEGKSNMAGYFRIVTGLKRGSLIEIIVQSNGYESFRNSFVIENPSLNRWTIKLTASNVASAYEAYESIVSQAIQAKEGGDVLEAIRLFEEARGMVGKELLEEPKNYLTALTDLAILYKKAQHQYESQQIIENLLLRGHSFLNEFKIPPPVPSARKNIPRKIFAEAQYLGDVDVIIAKALDSCGYYERSYFAIPNGFALVARLERINQDATSKQGIARWDLRINKTNGFSLKDYLEALIYGNPGYFRVIVFVIHDQPFKSVNVKISREQALHWLDSGLTFLPPGIRNLRINTSHYCTSLIYEFELPDSGTAPKLLYPGKHTGKMHLIRSNLWDFLHSKSK